MDTEFDGEEGSDVDVLEMLELQLAEIEMLSSMFPNHGEFTLDDPSAIGCIRAFIDGKTKYEHLMSRIGFSVKINPKGSKFPLELVCNLPHEYPSVTPSVFTRCEQMNRTNHKKLNEELDQFIENIERGEICLLSVIEWIQQNLKSYITYDPKSQNKKQEVDYDTVFNRLWIYSHHIYSKFKRRDILDWAQELKLSGFSLPGKPGVVCVEGYSRNVDEYWHRLRRQNWKRLAIKEKEEFDIGKEDIAKYKKFPDFQEKLFDVRGGKGREYHMDLGKLYEYMCEHDSGNIFSLYFGVDGKTAND